MKLKHCLSLLAAALAALPSSADAQLIINGSFESPVAPIGDFLRTSLLPGWTVSGDVDVIHMNFWQAADGSQSLDLSGDTGPGTTIAQEFSTVPEQAYLLSFFYANNADAAFASGSVLVHGSGRLLFQDLFHGGSTRQDMDYTLFQQVFVADADVATLRFTHLDSPNPFGRGLALDAVTITPVPEPSTLALVGLCGVGALCVALRRRGLAS